MNLFLQKLFLSLFVFVAVVPAAKAQLQARFLASKAGGCSPLVVTFTNQTTGASSSATYSWDFGNGNQSTGSNPSAIYTEEKTYTVTLTVTDGTAKSASTQSITVYKKPTVSFSADLSKGCAPLSVGLTATATPGDGTLQSWFWDYGDGQTESGASLAGVRHTFDFSQQATVSLTVQNSFGCQATVVRDSVVNVLPKTEAVFSAAQTMLCRIKDPVTFINSSKGPGSLQYEWNFGDGATSTAAAPSHVYASRGNYDISLTVKSSEGCVATKTMPSYINAANYQSEVILPERFCTMKETKIMSRSTPQANNTEWDVEGYGSGWGIYGQDVGVYYFHTPGTSRLQMINTFGPCKDTVYKTITIQKSPELRGFIAEPSTPCGGPATVHFKDTTAGAVSWKWNFNCNYNCPAPDATTQKADRDMPYASLYSVMLEVGNAAGCTWSFIQTVDLQKPQMFVDIVNSSSVSFRDGCTGMTMSFKASRPADIKQYKWTFPDDNSTFAGADPVHTFSKPGVYRVRLDYVLQNGCTGTTESADIRVHDKPKFDFVAQNGTDICGNTPVRFIGTSSESQDWYWQFGDGETKYIYGGSQNTIDHKYEAEGKYTVTLVTRVEGCWDTLVKTHYLTVKPPFPKIAGYLNSCEGTRGEVHFTDGSRQAESWRWEFGDGASLSYNTPPAEIKHTYQKTGTYNTVLTVTNGACTVKDSVATSVLLKQKPLLAGNQTVMCSDQWMETTITGLERNAQAYYNWAQYYVYRYEYVGGKDAAVWPISLTGYDPGPDMKFKMQQFDRGVNQFRAILQSDHFRCLDTTNFFTVTIKGPVAGFTAERTVCSGNAVTFTDTSKGTGGIPIVSWFWSFGDGSQATYNTATPFVHHYPYAGSYNVNFAVTDKDGCKDSKYVPYLGAGGIKAVFTPSATTVSPNTVVHFVNNTFDNYTNATTYRWLFGDGSSSAERDPQHAYTQPGTYTVQLLATSLVYGCTDTAEQKITVRYINSAFDFSTTYLHTTSCPPVLVRFSNKSVNASRVSWDFGDGARAEGVLHPSHLYTRPGKHIITLRTYSDNGTEYLTRDSVTIRTGANAAFLTDKLMACTSGAVTFTAQRGEVASYTWDYGDGSVQQTTDSFSVHQFSSAGIYAPALLITDTGGCVAGARMTEKIVIDSLQIAIGAIPSACNEAKISFQPTVNSVAAASQGPQVLRYFWDFGTGVAADTANVKSPAFSFRKPGTYTVRFSVWSPSGCSRQVTQKVVIDEKIKAVITGPAELCEGGSAQFSASAAAVPGSWGWNFGQGGTSSQQKPAAQVYALPGTYQVALTTTNGACTDTAFYPVVVHPLPAISLPQNEVLLCAGSTVQLAASGGAVYQWKPVTGLSDPAIANPVASPAVSTTYTLEALSAFGCKATDTVRITVAPPMNLRVSSDVTICSGSQVQLAATGATSYQWITNTAGLNNTAIPNPFAKPQTTTTYFVRGADAFNCFADTAAITVAVAPLPTVNAGLDVLLAGGNSHNLQPVYSADVVSWTWTPTDYLSCSNCAAPVVTPGSDMVYTVTARNAFGCSASDNIKIVTQCSESRIYIPDAFTPNGDARNPTFRIRGSGVKEVTHLAIYNRWGELIFEKRNFTPDDASAAWNGKFRGQPVTAGTYVYFVEFQCASGEKFAKKGTVTVIY